MSATMDSLLRVAGMTTREFLALSLEDQMEVLGWADYDLNGGEQL